MTILKVILVLIILYLIYRYWFASSFVAVNSRTQTAPYSEIVSVPENPGIVPYPLQPGISWSNKLLREELSPEDWQRHYDDMVRQAPIFSTGAGYSVVADDNNNPAFTQYYGLFRPSYVPVYPAQRQVTDIDVNVMKRNKRVRW